VREKIHAEAFDAFLTALLQKLLGKTTGSAMKQFCFLVAVAVSLSACALADKMDARKDMEGSKAAYKACLADNPKNVSACDARRLSYEADLKAYEATAAGMLSSR
jgi:hypothetical protein